MPARQAVVVMFMMLELAHLTGCKTFGTHPEPLRASLVTDSTVFAAYHRGNAYVANIGFTFTNNTGKTISRAGCGGPGWPSLEKKVNERWVPAYYPVELACRTEPDFSWKPGAQIRSVLGFLAFEPGHNTEPQLLVDSIDGVYRLRWGFTEGREAGAKGAKQVEATSNEFSLKLRSSLPAASKAP